MDLAKELMENKLRRMDKDLKKVSKKFQLLEDFIKDVFGEQFNSFVQKVPMNQLRRVKTDHIPSLPSKKSTKRSSKKIDPKVPVDLSETVVASSITPSFQNQSNLVNNEIEIKEETMDSSNSLFVDEPQHSNADWEDTNESDRVNQNHVHGNHGIGQFDNYTSIGNSTYNSTSDDQQPQDPLGAAAFSNETDKADKPQVQEFGQFDTDTYTTTTTTQSSSEYVDTAELVSDADPESPSNSRVVFSASDSPRPAIRHRQRHRRQASSSNSSIIPAVKMLTRSTSRKINSINNAKSNNQASQMNVDSGNLLAKCRICKQFVPQSALNVHQRIHDVGDVTDEKPLSLYDFYAYKWEPKKTVSQKGFPTSTKQK